MLNDVSSSFSWLTNKLVHLSERRHSSIVSTSLSVLIICGGGVIHQALKIFREYSNTYRIGIFRMHSYKCNREEWAWTLVHGHNSFYPVNDQFTMFLNLMTAKSRRQWDIFLLSTTHDKNLTPKKMM